MEDILKIGCPVCGAVLSVRNQAGLESKSVTCPICKNKSPFTSFKRIADKVEEECTQYPDEDRHEKSVENEMTDLNVGLNFTLGQLHVVGQHVSFQLKPGRNVIGRRTSGSSSTVQIPCESKRMSREHLIIEVKKNPAKGFMHYVSLYKEQVNPTFIGNVKLEYGDSVVLKDGDIIKLPEVDLRFMVPDEDKTEI